MTDFGSPAWVQQASEKAYDALENAVSVYAQATMRAATTDAEYELDYAVAFQKAVGSVELRKAIAIEKTYEKRLARDVARAAEKAAKANLQRLEMQIRQMQTASRAFGSV